MWHYWYWYHGYVAAIYIARASCQKGPTHHAYALQIGRFWQDTPDKADNVQKRPCEFQDSPVIWLIMPRKANQAHLGILPVTEKNWIALK